MTIPKHIFFIVVTLLVCTAFLESRAPLETWYDFNIEKRLGKKYTLFLQNELEFDNGIDNLIYAYAEPFFIYHIGPNTKIGPNIRLGLIRAKGRLRSEYQAGAFINHSFHIGPTKFFTRLKVFRRKIASLSTRHAIRARIGLNIIDTETMDLYISNEFMFGYGRAEFDYDTNYTSVGLTGKLDETFSWGLYYIYQQFRVPGRGRWEDMNTLGFALTLAFNGPKKLATIIRR